MTAVPAEVLRQRPDVRALETEIVATVADVGAAKADLYPSLSLSGSISITESTFTGRSVPWTFGPALSIPLLDGGSRRAAVRSAVADYDIAVARYKSGVLMAVADVETALVRFDTASQRINDARRPRKTTRVISTPSTRTGSPAGSAFSIAKKPVVLHSRRRSPSSKSGATRPNTGSRSTRLWAAAGPPQMLPWLPHPTEHNDA